MMSVGRSVDYTGINPDGRRMTPAWPLQVPERPIELVEWPGGQLYAAPF
jgi:hypothetical protein